MKILIILKKYLKKQKGLGLVEVLVSLAIVGTGMVIITSISLKTIKQARKNELQDVANQVAVEGLDFMKLPSAIEADMVRDGYYKLNYDPNVELVNIANASEIDESYNCASGQEYYIDLGTVGYNVCRQIYIESSDLGSNRYDVKVIVVWETVGGEMDKVVLEGHRIGEII